MVDDAGNISNVRVTTPYRLDTVINGSYDFMSGSDYNSRNSDYHSSQDLIPAAGGYEVAVSRDANNNGILDAGEIRYHQLAR